MIKCLRCGKCCIIYKYEKDQHNNVICGWIKCPYLIKDAKDRCTCVVYHKRFKKKLPYGYICKYREELEYDFPGCPYNKNRPIHPAYKDKKG